MTSSRNSEKTSRDELLALLAQRAQVNPPSVGPVRVGDLLAASDPLAGGPSCPSARELEDLLAGRLRAKPQAAVKEHLASCPSCRGYVARLRDAAAAGVPRVPPPPTPARPVFGTQHVFGLAVAGILLLLANSAILDILSEFETPAVTVTAPRPLPMTESVVAPAPVMVPAAEPETLSEAMGPRTEGDAGGG